MKSLLRRNLVLLMLGVTAAVFTANTGSPAFAKNGSDDGSSSSSSSSSGGDDSSSSSGSGSSSSGSSGSGSSSSGDNDSDDDNSSSGSDDDGHRSGSDDDSGHHSGGHDSNDDSKSRSSSNDDRRNSGNDDHKNGGGGGKAERARIQISVDAATRAGLLNGTLVAVDDLGRPLEVEVEDRNGKSVLIAKPHGGDAKRKPGPISNFKVVPASQAPGHG
jgi:hypothetical protein